MRHVLLLVGLVSLAGWAGAQTPAPEVDQDEVLRLGNIVQRIGGHQDEEVDGFVQVMALPADDIDKWFISVVTMQGCAPCAKLKKDWATDPWLRALAKPDDPKTSWAHFNYYDKDDKSQQWRFEKLRITAYPTVLVQPPRSGKYGNPSTVVYQNTYGGDPQALATAMTTAIRRYVATLPKQIQQRPDTRPPWQPTPKVEPPVLPDARPVFPDLRPNDPVVIPPELRPLQQVRSMLTDAAAGRWRAPACHW